MRFETSVEGDEGDVDVEQGGPSATSADGESNAAGGRTIRRRGTYMKDGPTVYKLIKPVLKAIKDAKSRE